MIPAIIVAAGCLALLGWTLWPLLRGSHAVIHTSDVELDDIVESKLNVYRSILDLELDHRLGKVSDDDYAVMRKQLESEALVILRKVDRMELVDPEELIEREIAEARNALRR